MRITSHAVCAPIVKIQPDGTLRLSRMEYTNREGFTTVRHIMETGKNGQTVIETLKEGVFKEGTLDPKNFRFNILTELPIYIDFVSDERNIGGTQMKVVFPISVEDESLLRSVERPDDDNPAEIHGPVTLVEASALIQETERHTIPFHFRATRAAIHWAGIIDKNVLDRYYRLVTDWVPRELTTEQLVGIEEYPKK